MAVKNKILKLEYTEEQNGKHVSKTYTYEIEKTTTNDVAKEVGQSIATLIKPDIDNYYLTTTETI